MVTPASGFGTNRQIRLSVRGLLLDAGWLLVVNAFRDLRGSDLWSAPDGGAEADADQPENLAREVHERTGPAGGRRRAVSGRRGPRPRAGFPSGRGVLSLPSAVGGLNDVRKDPERVVTRRRWVTRDAMAGLRFKPDALTAVAWGDRDTPLYDPPERLTR